MSFTITPLTRRAILGGLLAVTVIPTGIAEAQRRRSPQPAGTWVRLGEREIDGRRQTDTIEVNRRGTFRSLMFRVTDSAARIHNVTVRFENGSSFRPQVRRTFSRGTSSHVIDLPGRNRDIDRVTFRASDLRGGGNADVVLFGRR